MFLSSCNRDRFEFPNASQASSRVEAKNPVFLSSCKRAVRSPVKLRWGSLAFPRGKTGGPDGNQAFILS